MGGKGGGSMCSSESDVVIFGGVRFGGLGSVLFLFGGWIGSIGLVQSGGFCSIGSVFGFCWEVFGSIGSVWFGVIFWRVGCWFDSFGSVC